MIYFDNASTSLPKPAQVVEAMAKGLNTLGNPSRGAHGASLNSLRLMHETRGLISDFFNLGNPLRVAFTSGATAALNIAIHSIKGHIVTTAAEHNSVLRPLHRRGNFTVLPVDFFGRIDFDTLKKALRADTEAVVMCHASNLTGNVFDIAAIGSLCKKRSIKFIVDAAQSAGLIPIDMIKCNIDALCISGHKSLYGAQGTGALCLSESFTPSPLLVGGSGNDTFSAAHPTALPDALEAGTQNMTGIAALNAGIKYVLSQGAHVFKKANALANKFIKGLEPFEGKITLYGDIKSPLRIPVVALNINALDSAEVAASLFEEHGICVRSGGHCAPLMHEAFGTKNIGALRFSFSHLNTDAELDLALCALKEIIIKR